MKENRCVSCGALIPEGAQVCPICADLEKSTKIAIIKGKLWQIVRNEEIVITNQNIDWLLDRVFKEVSV